MIAIGGVILRCKDRARTAAFYSRLGLRAEGRQRGGSIHYEVLPISESFVVELHLASASFDKDAIMIEVQSLADVLKILEEECAVLPRSVSTSSTGTSLAYVSDPDGRDVMLYEKSKV
jgi:catechol 2,3-dioxygenase-like lactoylglutathione lyase family enzyme